MSNFAVKAVKEREGWRVLITQNGYQWQGLGIPLADEARAQRIADFLRIELAPDAERLDAEVREFVRREP